MKKIFIISLAMLLVVLFFLGIYNFAFKKDNTKIVKQETKAENQVKQENNLPKLEKIIAISDQSVIGAVFDKKNNSILYYSAKDGIIWKTDADGKGKQQVSSNKIAGLKSVSWSNDRTKTLTFSEIEGNPVFNEYEIAVQKNVTLKNGLDTAVWDNLGSKIFYKYFDQTSKARTLNIANPDGSGWQKLADINYRNLAIAQIPLTSLVSFWNAPAASEETLLQTVGVAGDEPRAVFRGRFGADYLWSPNGSVALISSSASQGDGKMTLGIVKLDGTYNDLNIPTIVSKTVWSSDNKTIYYALPGGIPNGSILPDDYQGNKFTTKDTFWKLDTTSGKKNRIVEPEDIKEGYDSTNLFLSSTEDALYFVNKIDKKLYKIEL